MAVGAPAPIRIPIRLRPCGEYLTQVGHVTVRIVYSGMGQHLLVQYSCEGLNASKHFSQIVADITYTEVGFTLKRPVETVYHHYFLKL